jgi:hypothetical protein
LIRIYKGDVLAERRQVALPGWTTLSTRCRNSWRHFDRDGHRFTKQRNSRCSIGWVERFFEPLSHEPRYNNIQEQKMRALRWHGKHDIRCDTAPDPVIEEGRDAIIKDSTCAICRSDPHLFDGFMPTMEKGDIMGHEFRGEVVEVGKDNKALRVGDRVVIPLTIFRISSTARRLFPSPDFGSGIAFKRSSGCCAPPARRTLGSTC